MNAGCLSAARSDHSVKFGPICRRLSRGVTPAVIQGVSFSSSGDWLAVSSARGTAHLFHLAAASPGCPLQQSAPPHLAAAHLAGQRLSGSSASLRSLPAPVKLLASGRVRGGGNGILNGSIPGSAAASAAVSLYSGAAGGSKQACSDVAFSL